MFTGIIEELGEVKSVLRKAGVTVFEISAERVIAETKIGDSIAVNGVCLTVVKITSKRLYFEAIPETFKGTNLGLLRVSEKVNLERSLKVGERISGHFVTGHIDCLGVIRRKGIIRGNAFFDIAVPVSYMKYCLHKGSIAIDGISLTLMELKSPILSVYIIPHTLKETALGRKGVSGTVNVEFDILAKKM